MFTIFDDVIALIFRHEVRLGVDEDNSVAPGEELQVLDLFDVGGLEAEAEHHSQACQQAHGDSH